jgi:opacity protein-like surface antigen
MRKIVFVVLTLVFLASLASAQVHGGNVFVGYSYYNTDLTGLGRNGLNGFEGSIEGKIIPWVGIVGDFSANYGNQQFPNIILCPAGVVPCTAAPSNVNTHIDNFLFGPRVSVTVGKIRPFAEGLVGFAHASTHGFGSDTSISSGVGGGIDYHLIPLVAWRLQADYLHSHLFSIAQNNVRVSTGIVIHF